MKRMSRKFKVKALLMIVMLIFTIATGVTAIASNSGSIKCKGYASVEELENLRLMFAENSGNLLAGER